MHGAVQRAFQTRAGLVVVCLDVVVIIVLSVLVTCRVVDCVVEGLGAVVVDDFAGMLVADEEREELYVVSEELRVVDFTGMVEADGI